MDPAIGKIGTSINCVSCERISTSLLTDVRIINIRVYNTRSTKQRSCQPVMTIFNFFSIKGSFKWPTLYVLLNKTRT